MNTTLTLLALPDGSCQCFYTEAIDLAAIGRLRIKRASTIEFDNPAQLWRLFDRQGRCLFASTSRSECLRWEQQNLTGPAADNDTG
jgi:hypothetical protein